MKLSRVSSKGKWEPRKIPNPDHFEEDHPYKLTPIGSLALELWSLADGIVFDNFLITSDPSIAKQYTDQLWDPKSILEGRPVPPSTPTKSSLETWMDIFIKSTRRKPWLWAIYVAVIVLPIIIIIALCYLLREPKRKKSSRRLREKKKKKNEDYADDDSNDDDEEIESKKVTKATLERPRSTERKPRRRTRRQ